MDSLISENETNFANNTLLSTYQNAIKEFDKLIEKGFAKKRENNLLSFTDAHLHRITLETSKSSFAEHTFGKSEVNSFSIPNSTKTNFNAF